MARCTSARALLGCLVRGALITGAVVACGGAEPQRTEPSEPPAEAQNPPAELAVPALPERDYAFQLSIDGWSGGDLGAKAQLNVTEGVEEVRLEITGGGTQDVVLFYVDFDGVEVSMGEHQVELGFPGTEIDSVVASLDGMTYHSQAGQVALVLAADGRIGGRFTVELALDPEFAPGEPIVFERSEEVRALTGTFSGHWDLYCQSHLPGHRSLTTGGQYCEELVFE